MNFYPTDPAQYLTWPPGTFGLDSYGKARFIISPQTTPGFSLPTFDRLNLPTQPFAATPPYAIPGGRVGQGFVNYLEYSWSWINRFEAYWEPVVMPSSPHDAMYRPTEGYSNDVTEPLTYAFYEGVSYEGWTADYAYADHSYILRAYWIDGYWICTHTVLPDHIDWDLHYPYALDDTNYYECVYSLYVDYFILWVYHDIIPSGRQAVGVLPVMALLTTILLPLLSSSATSSSSGTTNSSSTSSTGRRRKKS